MKQIPLPDQINQRPVLKFPLIRNMRRALEDRGSINERGPQEFLPTLQATDTSKWTPKETKYG